MTATFVPFTSTTAGANASFSSAPMPITLMGALRFAATESWRPSGPKSMPWLFAIEATSMPAACMPCRIVAGARKVNAFGAGVPRWVMAVSRFATVRSAPERSGVIGASRWAMPWAMAASARLSPLLSPAKATVNGGP